MQVEPSSPTNTPLRVSSFISRVMIVCSTVCSTSSVDASTSMKTGAPSVLRRYTPSSTHWRTGTWGMT